MNIKRAFLISMTAMLLPAAAFAQLVPAAGTAVFEVNKSFIDGNDETPVSFTMVCNSGNPVTQTLPGIEVSPGNFEVAFVLDNIPTDSGSVTCTITETAVGGYTFTYVCGGASGPAEDCNLAPASTTACVFENVLPDQSNFCDVTNTPNMATITITKEWIVEGAGGNVLDFSGYVDVRSSAFFSTEYYGDAHECYESNDWCGYVHFEGPSSGSEDVYVYPSFNGSKVYLDENFYDSVWAGENDCGGSVTVFPAGYQGNPGTVTCNFTNTAFFEGIPTLNQYGMAIMALLMLGVGFIGFRRFV